MVIETEKEEDNFIRLSTSVAFENTGYGDYFGDVGFVNPESIVNVIAHCAGHTKIGSIGFAVKDLSDTEVELTLAASPSTKH